MAIQAYKDEMEEGRAVLAVFRVQVGNDENNFSDQQVMMSLRSHRRTLTLL